MHEKCVCHITHLMKSKEVVMLTQIMLVIEKKISQIGCVSVCINYKVLHVEEQRFSLVKCSLSLVPVQDHNSPLDGKLQMLHLAVSHIPSWQMAP